MKGPTKTLSFRVQSTDSAKELQSGEMNVLATSALIRYMEIVSLQLAKDELNSQTTTVGVECKVRHLAPTAIGKEVVIKAKLMKQDVDKLYFEILAYEGERLIGEGKHIRMVVEEDVFLNNT